MADSSIRLTVIDDDRIPTLIKRSRHDGIMHLAREIQWLSEAMTRELFMGAADDEDRRRAGCDGGRR